MNKKVLVVFLVIIIVLLALIAVKPKSNPNSSANPHVDENGLYIPFTYKGTFKNIETDKVFEYSANDNAALANCLETKCTHVYFFADWNGAIDSPSLETNVNKASSVHGKIISSAIKNNGDEAEYIIQYSYNGKEYKSVYIDELCTGTKGGGKTCKIPGKEGAAVNIIPNTDGSTITYATFTNVIKAEVINLAQIK